MAPDNIISLFSFSIRSGADSGRKGREIRKTTELIITNIITNELSPLGYR